MDGMKLGKAINERCSSASGKRLAIAIPDRMAAATWSDGP